MDYITEIRRRIAAGEYHVPSQQLGKEIADKVLAEDRRLAALDRIRAKEVAARVFDREQQQRTRQRRRIHQAMNAIA